MHDLMKSLGVGHIFLVVVILDIDKLHQAEVRTLETALAEFGGRHVNPGGICLQRAEYLTRKNIE